MLLNTFKADADANPFPIPPPKNDSDSQSSAPKAAKELHFCILCEKELEPKQN